MHKIKIWYINFLEKNKLNVRQTILLFLLWLLSLLHAAIISIRDFLYGLKILPIYRCDKKIISIGNLSWSGTGKTTLALYLYEKLSSQYKLCVLRRGYGDDEEKLFGEKKAEVFSSVNRVNLVKKLSENFDLFLLDDGFQYRKLYRNLNIVVMGAREFERKIRLLPAGIFREPLSALKRANILIINYSDDMVNFSEIKSKIQTKYSHLKVFGAYYKLKRIFDLNGKEIPISALQNQKIAALAAIGYPQGFFNQIQKSGIRVIKTIAYPDHYEFTKNEFGIVEEGLENNGIRNCLITYKDKYHLPEMNHKINFYIFEIEIKIDEESRFLEEIKQKIN